MAVPEQFSLRWNDFHSNLSQSFHALLECEDLVDVTLAAGGQYVHAHKLILSVCSPYFKELFKMNPCEHPIVILKDVAHQELRQLLQFMYRGEVHVRRQELSGFLHTAELLQVKGLTGGRERSESPSPPQEEPKPVPQQLETPAEHSSDWGSGVEDTTSSVEIASDQADTISIKEEATRSPLKRLLKNTPNKTTHNAKKKSRPIKTSPTHPENTEYAYDGEPLIDFDNDLFHSVLVLPESTKESEDTIQNLNTMPSLFPITRSSTLHQDAEYSPESPHTKSGWNCKTGGVKCPSCHRFFANRYNLKVHIRDKHDTREGTLQCDICQKRMRNPSCLRVHMYHHRKQAAYLAQLTTQGDQIKHVVQNMVGGKWRSESAIASGDYKDIDNYQQGSTPECNKAYIAQLAGQGEQMRQIVPNMAGGKWRSDSSSGSADYKDTDSYPQTADSNRSQNSEGASQSAMPETGANYATPEAALPKPEADVETA